MAGLIGVFGGTFDPPHIAHLILASEAKSQLGLDRILWVLTTNPPHKQGQRILPVESRIALLQAAICENPSFELSRVDIDRPPPHFAADTLALLSKAHPSNKLVYLIGGDSLRDLPTWHAPAQVLQNSHYLGVMPRPGVEINLPKLEISLPGITRKVRVINIPLLDISSSEIRRRIKEGLPFQYYLPSEVYKQIIKLNLYQDQ
jgi:nicotinate-nucleotide adenylyltransferase